MCRMRTIIYFLLLLSLSTNAQTKRALVIGLGEQQDKAWNKINGDKDVALVEGMLKRAGFKSRAMWCMFTIPGMGSR